MSAPDQIEQLIRRVAIETAHTVIADIRREPLVHPEWMNAKATAQYLSVSEQTLSVYVKTGVAPPSVKWANNARRFRRADADAWAAAGGTSQFRGRAVA